MQPYPPAQAQSVSEDGRIFFDGPLRPSHVINFPAAESLGIVTLKPAAVNVIGSRLQAAARGKIVVPKGYCAFFDAGYRFLAKPEIVKTMPPDVLDSITITASSFSDSEDGKVDRALAQIVHFKGLREVLLDKSDATDAGIANLSQLPNLQRISIYATNSRGYSFKQLATIKPLKVLRASRTNLTPANLKYLGEMHNLIDLSLQRCQLDDLSLASLSGCPKLFFLDIGSNSKLSNACLKNLTPLKQLSWLWIEETGINWSGLKQLEGVPLKHLYVENNQIKPAEMILLKKKFPGIIVEAISRVKRVDIDTGSIFAPLP